MKKTVSVLLMTILIACASCESNEEQVASAENATPDSITKTGQESLAFDAFLRTFIQSIKDENGMGSYVQKEIGVYMYTNPGVHCLALKSEGVETMKGVKEIPIQNIFNRKPKGDFCTGFPGEKDGFYYSEITKNELPAYYDTKSAGDKKVILPTTLAYKRFVCVNVVIRESFSVDMYFALVDSTWYLIGQNFCDCSA